MRVNGKLFIEKKEPYLMKLDKQTAKYYYTAAEARGVLGLDEQSFQYWIRRGRIKKVQRPGRSQAVYSKREVNELATRIAATILTEQPADIVFGKATIDDIEKEAALAHLIFGEKADAKEECKAFIEKNHNITYHLYDKDQLVAYINVVPLEHEAIEEFMLGKVIAWNIDTNKIRQFTPGEPIGCLIIDMITTPLVPPARRTFYGSRLLSELVKILSEAGRQGVEITKLYAASDTPTGIRILKNAGFQIIHESRKGRFSFMLDIEHSNEKILKEYQKALAEWKETQKEDKPTKRNRQKKPTTPNT
jgi:hypothetical protein